MKRREAEVKFSEMVTKLCSPEKFAAAVDEYRRIVGWCVDQVEVMDFVDCLYSTLGIEEPDWNRECYEFDYEL